MILTSLLTLFVLSLPRVGLCENTYDSLRARYLKLRNVDPSVNNPSSWLALAADLEHFVREHSGDKMTPSLMYDASIVSEILYTKTQEPRYLKEAITYLDTLSKKYTESEVAPEALVRLGDLHLYLEKNTEGATGAYQQVVETYADSEMSTVAKQRLQEIHKSASNQENQKTTRLDKADNENFLIVLDPGHGGEDHGAKGVGGLYEKDVTLAVALLLEKYFRDEPGVSVRLTRRADSFVPLQSRSQMANQEEADLFVSLHVNASEKKNSSGYEVYYLDNTRDVSSKRLADRENASMNYEGGGSDLMFMLSDLITTAQVNESIPFARHFYDTSLHSMKSKSLGVRGRGVKKAPLYVLVGTTMPSILVEMLFVDSTLDGKKLASEEFRQKLAESLFDGLKSYVLKSEPEVLRAQR